MIDNITLKAEIRHDRGKGAARKLRADGKLPAVMYGRTTQARPLTLDLTVLTESLRTEAGANILIRLDVPGAEDVNGKTVMVRELQRDPLSHQIVHSDFVEVRMDEAVRVEVPIRFIGKAIGVQEGGILQEMHRSLSVECLPQDIPDHLEVDVSELLVGQVLHLEDITIPEGLTATAEGNIPLAQVLGAQVEEEEEEKPVEEGEEAAEAKEAEGEKDKKEEKE